MKLLMPSIIQTHSYDDYQVYNKLLSVFHEDIKDKNLLLQKAYKEGPLRIAVKWFINGIKAILQIGTGWITGRDMVGLIGFSTMAFTPFSWPICIMMALFSLGTFFFMRRKGINKFIDDVFGDPQGLKKEQNKFIKGSQGILLFNHEMVNIMTAKKFRENNICALRTQGNDQQLCYSPIQQHLRYTLFKNSLCPEEKMFFKPKLLVFSSKNR